MNSAVSTGDTNKLNIHLGELIGKFLSRLLANLGRLEVCGVYRLHTEEINRPPICPTLRELGHIAPDACVMRPADQASLGLSTAADVYDAYGSNVTDAFIEQLPERRLDFALYGDSRRTRCAPVCRRGARGC